MNKDIDRCYKCVYSKRTWLGKRFTQCKSATGHGTPVDRYWYCDTIFHAITKFGRTAPSGKEWWTFKDSKTFDNCFKQRKTFLIKIKDLLVNMFKKK